MKEHEHDLFYKVDQLSLKKKKELLKDVYQKSYEHRVDALLPGSWSRQQIDMPFNEIMLKLKKDSHFVFIHRRGFKGLHGEYLVEAGFVEDSHYLWLFCKEELLEYFVKFISCSTIIMLRSPTISLKFSDDVV